MKFHVKPVIVACDTVQNFLNQWNVGSEDLLITNAYLLPEKIRGTELPCGVLYQEDFGSGEPTDEMVDAMLSSVTGKTYNRVIAIGGGTVIDIAKLFVFGDGLKCEEIFEKGSTLNRKRDLVLIPTTCGTGSEVTNISIVGFIQKNTKMGLATDALYADEAVLISELLNTMPYEVFAASSVDALIHGMESFISPKANPFTRSLGQGAIEMILSGYMQMADKKEMGSLPGTLPDFLKASTMAGVAFGNAGVGAVHALSYPIGAMYHVPHGKANYMMFESVFHAYREAGADLSKLEDIMGTTFGCTKGEEWNTLFALLDQVIERPRISAFNADETTCAEMAESVIKNQQRLLVNSPVDLTEDQIRNVYVRCL